MKYIIKKVQWTAKTTNYQIWLDDLHVCYSENKQATENLVSYLERNEIYTLESWNKKTDSKIRLAFGNAFAQSYPNFPNEMWIPAGK